MVAGDLPHDGAPSAPPSGPSPAVASVAVECATPAAPAPSLVRRPPVYVIGFDALDRVTASDFDVNRLALALRGQHENATNVRGLGVVAGGVAALATFIGTDGSEHRAVWTVTAGVGTMIVGFLWSLAFEPQRQDLYDVINAWNAKHPDGPLAP